MKKILLAIILSLVLNSCSKKEEKPLSSSDTILSKPVTENAPEAQPKADSVTGLLIDQSRYYSPEDQKLLDRFEAKQVAIIYHDFRTIRKPGISQMQIDSFTKAKKISADELKAIL